MFNPELEVVRFQAEDIVTTSVPPGFSPFALKADTTSSVAAGKYAIITSETGCNTVDGVANYDGQGAVLTVGSWYHFKLDESYGSYGVSGNWVTCTDASHYGG